MCGIAGLLSFSGPVDRVRIDAMVGALAHRGPDDQGLLVEGGVALGMRRLAVIDLSPLGHQPMENEDGSVAVVFNGELYNFLDLRCRLIAEGHTFRSHSDTEVLVHGYETWGARGLLTRIEGMFAFALLDRRAGLLLLARDQFGVKPLYLRRAAGHLSFASELRSLVLDGLGKPGVDPAFLGSYLRVGFVPSPGCAFRGVEKLPPGTLLQVDVATGREEQATYYELRPLPRSSLGTGIDELAEQLEGTLDLAVRRQLVSDAPLGVFLSGGLDSSALTQFAVRHQAGRLQTYSIGFLGSDRGDESEDAAEVARLLGADNHCLRIDPASLDELPEIVASLGEPIGDSAILPLWSLCRSTRHGVTVALSGEGGDEALGGYGRYYWAAVGAALGERTPPGLGLVRRLAGLLPQRTHGPLNLLRRAGKFASTMELPEASRYLAWFDLFGAAERTALTGTADAVITGRVERLFKQGHALGLDAVQRMQYVDINTFLLDNLLLKSDRLSMAHSLEVRVPLLDRGVLELGLSLPIEAKVTRWQSKVLLRRLLRKKLPRAARRPKRGFEPPVDAWFRGGAGLRHRERLIDGRLAPALGFSRGAVQALVSRHEGGEDLGRQLFALLVLEEWAGLNG